MVTRDMVVGTAEVECPMQYLNGVDINACLNWNEYYYWLWFEINDVRDFEWEELNMMDVIKETEHDLDDISVIYCSCLDDVNKYIRKYNGDSDFHGFVDDEVFGGIMACY